MVQPRLLVREGEEDVVVDIVVAAVAAVAAGTRSVAAAAFSAKALRVPDEWAVVRLRLARLTATRWR